MVPETIYEDEAQGVVIIHARMEGLLKSGGGRENECVLLVRLSGDGKEVVEIREFVDSVKAVEMRVRYAPRELAGDGEEKMVGQAIKERRMSC